MELSVSNVVWHTIRDSKGCESLSIRDTCSDYYFITKYCQHYIFPTATVTPDLHVKFARSIIKEVRWSLFIPHYSFLRRPSQSLVQQNVRGVQHWRFAVSQDIWMVVCHLDVFLRQWYITSSTLQTTITNQQKAYLDLSLFIKALKCESEALSFLGMDFKKKIKEFWTSTETYF